MPFWKKKKKLSAKEAIPQPVEQANIEVEEPKPIAEAIAPVIQKLEPTLPPLEHLPVEPIKSRKYTVDDVDAALLCLAVHGGNTRRASEELAGRGIEVAYSTLGHWRREDYPERYRYIQENHARQLEDVLVRSQREVALSASLKALEGIDSIDIALMESKDRPRAVQALQTSAAIATDKVLTLTGRPTQVTEHRSAQDILKRLGGHVIDGEAVEISQNAEGPHIATLPASSED